MKILYLCGVSLLTMSLPVCAGNIHVPTPTLSASKPQPPPARLSAWYNLIFYNDSNYATLTLTKNADKTRCMYESGPDTITIPPGGEYPLDIEDGNPAYQPWCHNDPYIDKTVLWDTALSDGSAAGKIEFMHSYHDTFGLLLSEWRTMIKEDDKSNYIDAATCKGKNCLNTSVKDSDKHTDIRIWLLKNKSITYTPLVIQTPPPNSTSPSPYQFTPSGSGIPGGTVSYTLDGCTQCQPRTLQINDNGQWADSSPVSLGTGVFTLHATQEYKGYAIPAPEGTASNSFTVNNPAVNTQINTPVNLSWIDNARSSFLVLGSTMPASDAENVRCFVDEQNQRQATPSTDGEWRCLYNMPTAGKHSFSGRVLPVRPGDTDLPVTYMIAARLIITAPLDNALMASPAVLSGIQQPGATVQYTSDHCGSGTARTDGTNWVTPPFSRPGKCTFSFTQSWQGMTSQPVTRTLTIATPPHIIEPELTESIPVNTRYSVRGTGQPGATISVSLGNGWYQIDNVPVNQSGLWAVSTLGPRSGTGVYTLSAVQQANRISLGRDDKDITVSDEVTAGMKAAKKIEGDNHE